MFTVIVKFKNNSFCTYHKVSKISSFKRFLDSSRTDWIYYTVYNKKNREKVDYVQNN